MKLAILFSQFVLSFSLTAFAANTNYTTTVVQSTYAIGANYVRVPSAAIVSTADRSIKVGGIRATVGKLIYIDQAYSGASGVSDGSLTRPFKTIQAGVAAIQNAAENTLIISEGTYREYFMLKGKTPSRLFIQAKQSHTVFIKGSDLKNSGWLSYGNGLFYLNYSGPQAQMAFINRRMLQQVNGTIAAPTMPSWGWPGRILTGTDPTRVPADSFWHDTVNQKIWVRTPGGISPNGQLMEIATRERWMDSEGVSNLLIQDLNFEHSNTMTFRDQGQGALHIYNNSNVTIDNISAAFGDGSCVSIGPTTQKNIKIINSNISYCGQTGISGVSDGAFIQNNKIKGNNIRAFSELWHAGGLKVVSGFVNSTVDNNEISYNYGPGYWCDFCRVGYNKVTNNLFLHNKGQGIHLEVSTRHTITGNYFFGNSIGVYIRAGSYNTVQNNVIMMSPSFSIDIFDDSRAVNVPGGCTCYNILSSNKIVIGQLRMQKPASNTSNTNYYISSNANVVENSKTLPAWTSFSGGDDAASKSYNFKDPKSFTVDAKTLADRLTNKIYTSKAQMDQYYSLMAL